MHRVRIFVLALVWLCPRAAAAADASGCTLKMVNTIPLTMARGGARPLVSVKVNGTELKFLLDTGGVLTQISAAAAQELKLPVTESGGKLLNLYGDASSDVAMVETFTLGRLSDRNTHLHVMTGTRAGTSRNGVTNQQPLFDGLLSADYMGEYDIELDFAGGKMNYFKPDHCDGNLVYWPAAAIAAVPMLFRANHLNLDVTLDGRPLKAMIDTGAPNTTLFAPEAARVFGVKDAGADQPEKAFEHVFQKLSFEGLEVANPHILIIPDKVGSKDPDNDYITGSRVKRVDDRDAVAPVMLIGMNVLSKLHLYIAFSQNKIYITPASPPPAASTLPPAQ